MRRRRTRGDDWDVLKGLLRPTRLAVAFVVVVALVAHVLALRAGYVLDDDALLVRNPWVHARAGWRGLVTHELFEASGEVRYAPYYRPLSGLLYWTSYHLLGAGSAAQHALNIAFHGVASVLVFKLIHTCVPRVRIAAFTAALFAAHPATVELVAYVGGRQDLSGWIATLLGLLATERLRRHPRAWIANVVVFVTVALAAGFREFFLTTGLAFVVAPAVDALHDARRGRGRTVAVAVAPPVAAWMLAVAFNLGLRHAFHVGSLWAIAKDDPNTIGVLSGTFLRLLHDTFLPTDLAIDVTIDHPFLGAIAAATACTVAAVLLYRSVGTESSPTRRADTRKLLGYGIVFPALITVSHVPVVQTNGCFSDRYAYGFVLGAMLVLAVVLAMATDAVAGSTDRLQKAWPAVFALPLVLCPTTWSRAADFRDEDALQVAMFRDRPDDPESGFAAGMHLVAERHFIEAGPLCERWRARHPAADRANLCLAHWHLAKGEPREAVELAATFLESRPGHALGREVLFAALVASRQFDRAHRQIDDLLRIFPNDPQLLDQRERLAAAGRGR